ncbi:nickel-dependent lactate racemase [Thermodesulfobacteriota bacterium]
MDQYFLLSKDKKVHFEVPEAWSVLNNVALESEKPDKSLDEMFKQAITEPIGTPPLADLVKPTDKIVIVVDDFTRPTPKAEILTSLVGYLGELGIGHDQIDILFGVGTHRPLTEEEITMALGPSLAGKLRCTSHDCWSKDLVPVGTSKAYGELKVDPLMPAADFRIAVGSVLPHPMAGFGGGPKLIMPGVSDFEFIRRHHMTTFLPRPFLGEAEGNPCRDGINEAARLADLNFIVNTVYNTEHEIMAIVAGDFEKAHQAGVRMGLDEYAVEIDPKADVTLISAYPYDEGNQIIKPLIPGAMVTKKGGTVILFASAIHGGRLPEPMLSAFDEVWAQVKGDPAETAIDCISHDRLIVKGGPLDFNAAAYLSLLIFSRVKVILVTKDATKEDAARVGFDYAPTIEEAIETVAAKTGRHR